MKITLITVCLERGFELEKTIQSVLSQTWKNLEYLVIDGGSSDNTTQILEKYQQHLISISEKDNGIYHAMNKGIKRSTGDYLLFLNAGDYFKSNISLQILVENCSDEDLVFGDIIVLENDACWVKTYPDTLTLDYFLTDTLPHPATLIRQSLFNKVGLYDEVNKIVSDWSFFLDAVCKFNATYKHVKSEISIFNADGISSLSENASLISQEKQNFLLKNYSDNRIENTKLKLRQSKFNLLKIPSLILRHLNLLIKSFN